MSGEWKTFADLLSNLGQDLLDVIFSLFALAGWLLRWWVAIAWFGWWLFGVNWSKLWPVLGRGAWLLLLLGGFTAALVWSRLAPGGHVWLGLVTLPNFWSQLTGVGVLILATIFCGWLQGRCGWRPTEIDLEPAEAPGHASAH